MDGHSSGTDVATRLIATNPGSGGKKPLRPCLAARRRPPLFGLAPGGVYPADPVARTAVRSYRTVSPLPAQARAVCFLWHCPWGRPRRLLAGTVSPWSPDFPPAVTRQRPSSRLDQPRLCARCRFASSKARGSAPGPRWGRRAPDPRPWAAPLGRLGKPLRLRRGFPSRRYGAAEGLGFGAFRPQWGSRGQSPLALLHANRTRTAAARRAVASSGRPVRLCGRKRRWKARMMSAAGSRTS